MIGIIKNQIKTILLLGILSGILLGVGQLVGGRQGLFIGLIFALIMNIGGYWFSDKIVLKIYRAKEVSKEHSPKLHKIVDEVCKKADIPKPRVYLLPTKHSNAFATGRNPKNSAVACTEGIIELLNEDELKGVIAHEVAHIKNRDILITTIAGVIASVISYIGFIARWGAIFGSDDDNRGGNILSIILLAVITPLVATLLQLAISRSREYFADESGAKYTNEPESLAKALEKIDADAKVHPLK
ncbi:MAG: zinc metalloprotease HtpX, partial [Nanoarchaeota archaeon]